MSPEIESVYHSASRKACLEHFLVLQAMGIDSDVLFLEGEFALVVSAQDGERARTQLSLYRQENQGWSVAPVAPLPHSPYGWNGIFLYATVLFLLDFLQQNQVFSLDWWEAGKAHTGLIRQGEWWRCVTALSLHVDLAHLVGNLIFGGLFGLLVSRQVGGGLAWLAILLAGALGNGVNAFLQGARHTSVGASTAVFGALGVLAAVAWSTHRRFDRRWLIRWAPATAGVVLLAMLGTGGERTDVTAHLTGFVAGGLVGVGVGRLRQWFSPASWLQWLLGVAALVIFALSWVMALQTHG